MAILDRLEELVAMSRRLGDPALDYAILGEGNTSAAADEETFWIKASGLCLRDIDARGFPRVRRDAILALLDRERVSDDELRVGVEAARTPDSSPLRPSVETLFHAYLLSLEGVRFVGHTHPTPVNAILCSREGEAAVRGRLFPDEIVCCGVAPVWVAYTDPGQPLSRAIRVGVQAHLDRHGVVPRILLMQNHGLIALGRTAQEVESATAMAVKSARILLGTAAFGGPNFLTEENVRRIDTRPDEKYRERGILGRG
jgi:rhamnose utilization protein RhaD (predicted bifunctional aldolase and dehydrogenase)